MLTPLAGKAEMEIKDKVDYWHTRMTSQLYRFNGIADFWRLLKGNRGGQMDGFSNPQLSETMRATEAIATFMYRAFTSAMPNFQLLSHNPMVDQTSLWKSERVLEWQQGALKYPRKMMKGTRSLSLFGTLCVEEPFVARQPYYEGTDFVPRSLLQVAFDPVASDMEVSGWHALIDFVTEDQLLEKSRQMPDVWDADAIQTAIGASKQTGKLTPEVIQRLAAAGYYSYTGPTSYNASSVYQLVTYYGPLKDNDQTREWIVSVVNDLWVIRAHPSPYRRRPLLFTHVNEFEMEPYGYGVGRVAEAMQPELNANRGRMNDTITFSLFNMWIASRMANIKTSQLRVRPWGVVETDDAEGLKPIRPQLEGVNFGIQLENLMKQEFRTTTGASDNLQALVTEATATESSLAQAEAVRRLSVMAEICAEDLVREHVSKMHENNLTFLDQPFWIANTGQGKPPAKVYPSDIAPDAFVVPKIVTDKDFRPQRNKDILQFLQVITSIRNQNPQLGQVNLLPWIGELARGIGMNPADIFLPAAQMGLAGPAGAPAGVPVQAGGPPPPSAMDQVGQRMDSMRGRVGQLGQEAHAQAMAGAAQ